MTHKTMWRMCAKSWFLFTFRIDSSFLATIVLLLLRSKLVVSRDAVGLFLGVVDLFLNLLVLLTVDDFYVCL